MTPVVKVASFLGILGTASATGVYFGTDLFKTKKTIADFIREKNPEKRLISSSKVSDDVGKKAYKTYRDENKEKEKGHDTWKLGNWAKISGNVEEVDTTEEFINKCQANSRLEASKDNDSLYRQALRYCTRATLVSDLIMENNKNRKLLKSSDQNSDSDGQEAGKSYRKDNKDKSSGQDFGRVTDGENKKTGDILPDNYKTTCDTKSSEEAFKLDDPKYLNFKNGCTVDK